MNTSAPPNNPELERAILSAVLRTNGQNIDSLIPIIKSADYFYSTVHRNIWNTFLAMHRVI